MAESLSGWLSAITALGALLMATLAMVQIQ